MTPQLNDLLASVESQSQALADGMKVNKEKLARELIQVTGIVRTLNQRLAEANNDLHKANNTKPSASSPFDSDIFKDIFGSR